MDIKKDPVTPLFVRHRGLSSGVITESSLPFTEQSTNVFHHRVQSLLQSCLAALKLSRHENVDALEFA
jgi:hypothetical protein